ncbi:MAG: hypothetical protein QW192_06280 [Candidatus Caldarchaeum sp.]
MNWFRLCAAFGLTVVLLAGLFGTVSAQFSAGSFIKYSYQLVGVDGKVVGGDLTVTVVNVLDEGFSKLRYEATFPDGSAMFEKRLPRTAFAPPMFDFSRIEGEYRIVRDGGNVSYAMSIVKIGQNQRTVGGFNYATDEYVFDAMVKLRQESLTTSGRAETISGSNALYGLALTMSSSRGEVSVRLQLVDSNVDLTQFRQDSDGNPVSTSFAAMLASAIGDLSLAAQIAAFSAFSSRPSASSISESENVSAPANQQTARVAMFGLIGAATLATIGFFALRTSSRITFKTDRKPHYV